MSRLRFLGLPFALWAWLTWSVLVVAPSVERHLIASPSQQALASLGAVAGLPSSDFTESFENGTFDQSGWVATGNVSNVTSTAGGYTGAGTKSYRAVPAGVASYITNTKGADSTNGTFRIGLYITTLPTSFTSILVIKALNTNTVLDIYMAGGTTATVRGATNASITLTAGAWHNLEIKQNKNAASTVRVDGGADQSFTGNNDNFGVLIMGANIYSTDGSIEWGVVQWNNSASAYIGQ